MFKKKIKKWENTLLYIFKKKKKTKIIGKNTLTVFFFSKKKTSLGTWIFLLSLCSSCPIERSTCAGCRSSWGLWGALGEKGYLKNI